MRAGHLSEWRPEGCHSLLLLLLYTVQSLADTKGVEEEHLVSRFRTYFIKSCAIVLLEGRTCS